MKRSEFEVVVNEYGNDLFKFCCYLTLDKDLASELYQETFLRAFQINDRLEKISNKKAFLLGIAANVWKNSITKKMRRQRLAPVADYEEHKERLAVDGSVLEEYIEAELIEEVKRAVDRLPDKQRLVVLLHYMEDMPTTDIAGVLHIPKGTVLSRLAKARESLRKEMEARGYEI